MALPARNAPRQPPAPRPREGSHEKRVTLTEGKAWGLGTAPANRGDRCHLRRARMFAQGGMRLLCVSGL
jgi:hypothetical protein